MKIYWVNGGGCREANVSDHGTGFSGRVGGGWGQFRSCY